MHFCYLLEDFVVTQNNQHYTTEVPNFPPPPTLNQIILYKLSPKILIILQIVAQNAELSLSFVLTLKFFKL